MKKAKSTPTDTLRSSYKRSDVPGGLTRGKYATRFARGTDIVRLDPNIAAAFPTSEAVNEALGGLVRVAQTAHLTARSSEREGEVVAVTWSLQRTGDAASLARGRCVRQFAPAAPVEICANAGGRGR